MAFFKHLLILLTCTLVVYFIFDNQFDKKCRQYGWRDSFMTTKGVFCERAISSSDEVAFLPLEGARRLYEYHKRNTPPSRQGDS